MGEGRKKRNVGEGRSLKKEYQNERVYCDKKRREREREGKKRERIKSKKAKGK